MEFRLHLILSVCLLLCSKAQAETHSLIKQFPLDERVIYEIPIGRDAPTTLMFPSALTAIEAANVSANPETPAPVLLSYTPGRSFFSVRAQEPTATAALNVIWKNKTYVLRLTAGAESYGSVTFYEDDLPGKQIKAHGVTPETLLALLDRAKSFSLLQTQYPEAVQQIEHATPGSVSYYRDFRVTLLEAFRFDPEDTVVFRLQFDNTGDTEVVYQPQRLAVRVGHNVYFASIADASGIVPPHASTTAFFAVTGTPRGNRANLSPRNRFSIVVSRVERDAKLLVTQ